MRQLKESTLAKYSVLQIAKHAERYQEKAGLSLYRFDFAYGTIYEANGSNAFTPFGSFYESNHNRMMMIHALNSIYKEASK